MKTRTQAEREEDPEEQENTPRREAAHEYLQIAQTLAPRRAAKLRLLLMRGWALGAQPTRASAAVTEGMEILMSL
jgi:hypothetical protein